MCGIVGAVSNRPVCDILVDGLQRLEYRGYDSAGVTILDGAGSASCVKRQGKVGILANALADTQINGTTGIAHTRWATHGAPSERNAHPHQSGERFFVVHNGIIENHDDLRDALVRDGYVFCSDTDTEVIVHLIHKLSLHYADLRSIVQAVTQQLQGAYGMVVADSQSPDELVVSRSGSPIVIGYGENEHFIASDPLALLPVTRRFSVLEEGDSAHVTRESVRVFDVSGVEVIREVNDFDMKSDASDKAGYKHFMLKEIFEQPQAIRRTLAGRVQSGAVSADAFGAVFANIKGR